MVSYKRVSYRERSATNEYHFNKSYHDKNRVIVRKSASFILIFSTMMWHDIEILLKGVVCS